MDLIPKPDQVAAAAGNVAHTVLYGGLADLRPMPRTLIDDGDLREVYHYRPTTVATSRDPVLLVTPLAAPSTCYDLRRGCSLVQHVVNQGRPTYLVEYGEVSFTDRNLGLERFVREVVPAAVRAASAHAGGRPVHVVGWSLGGIFALLTAAEQPDLPIASLTVLAAPVDVSQVPLVAPLRPLPSLDLGAGGGLVTGAFRALGGARTPLVTWASQLSVVQKVVTKPLALLTHLDDTEFLAQIEAVDRFAGQVVAYPGRTFGQLYHRFVGGNDLISGSLELDGRTISLSAVTAPVLVLAGATDAIAPVAATKAVIPLLSGSQETQFEIVPGGHLGMLTGRAARTSTWVALDDWVARWSTPDVPTGRGATKKTPRPRKKAAAPRKKAATTPKKAAAPRERAATPRTKVEPGPEAIGANPERRYGSDGPRGLAR